MINWSVGRANYLDALKRARRRRARQRTPPAGCATRKTGCGPEIDDLWSAARRSLRARSPDVTSDDSTIVLAQQSDEPLL